eukprot:CAMPEP_0179112978 /NCGR_PEP_ID=MMETSP0796-20121207/52838_1 /TAXON_ID=73915 /ORGANISM="Pyrodinium bahamense, Strain pbaha01" /LENGTH=79 /DNA_ID=CAMNT_0020811165 /DNA_START=197 /DNA_END=436 /DNA_ORIENTATION=-
MRVSANLLTHASTHRLVGSGSRRSPVAPGSSGPCMESTHLSQQSFKFSLFISVSNLAPKITASTLLMPSIAIRVEERAP